MSKTTPKLGLFEYDPSTDGAQTFNIEKALNENWEKLDGLTPGDIGAADRETQDKVLATSTPSRTVTVAASELAAYVAAMPRMVNEGLTISVTSGTVSETLMLDGFYGSGRLTIAQASGASVQCTKGIRIQYCTLRIRLYNLAVSGEGAAVGGFQELISIGPASCVYVDSCTLTGDGSSRGISAGQGCIVEAAACTITHTDIALLMSKASVCAAYNCTGSSNTTGAYVYYGGCIMLAGSTPDTLGGSANVKSGGIIVKANGTLL